MQQWPDNNTADKDALTLNEEERPLYTLTLNDEYCRNKKEITHHHTYLKRLTIIVKEGCYCNQASVGE